LAEGYIALYRALLDKPIWKKSTPEQKAILITLLLMANHEENEWEWMGQKFKVFPGQFVTSLESIVNACGKGITIQNVRTALERFEKLEFLTSGATKCGRLITILKWQTYQVELKKGNKAPNKDLTKTSQRGNKDLTTNNNDNNDKNDKKNIYAEFVKMAEEEYQKLITQFGEVGTKERIERLNLYKGSTGKKYASDYLTILNWEKKNKDKPQQKSVSNFKGRTYDANNLEAQLLARSKNDGL
jgi:hypothetical protein